MNESKSILSDDFYGPLLAKGSIPGGDNISVRLLEAMAILIGRSVDGCMDPMECKGLVALVVLGLRQSGWVLSQPGTAPRRMDTDLLFKVIEPSAKHYEIFTDGRISGFSDGAIVCNYFPLLLAFGSGSHASEAGGGKDENKGD